MRVALPFNPNWHPDDPGRGCYTCGRPPDGTFADGSPKYICSHEPVKGPEGWVPKALVSPWIDIRRWLDCASRYAAERDEQKRRYQSSRYLAQNPHYLGHLAEHVYGSLIGQPVNHQAYVGGDGGTDFPGTDVKGVRFWQDPWLKHPASKPLRAFRYVVIALDMERKRGRYVGEASREELRAAPLKTWNEEAGPQLSLPPASLHQRLPDG